MRRRSMHEPSRNHSNADVGALSASLLVWLASALAVLSLIAGLGWAGVFGGDDGDSGGGTTVPTTTVPTEWPAVVDSDITLHECPAGAVVGQLTAGEPVTIVGRTYGNAWVAIIDPDDPSATVWVVAAALTPADTAPIWGALPVISCNPAGDSYTGIVVDSVTGVPVAGVLVAPTGAGDLPIDEFTVTTGADGTYTISGLTGEEYGLWVDGTMVGYEQGYVGSDVSALGYLVVPTWGEAFTHTPGLIGDIALDATATPTSTTTTSPPTPSTTTATAGQPPVIDSLTANPAVVAGFQLCGATGTMLSVVVTDDEAVESVVIEWSYPAVTAIGGPPGTAKGTLDLTHVAGTDMWQAPVSFWQQPVEEPQAFIALRVTAIDNDHLSWWRTFNTTLAIKHC